MILFPFGLLVFDPWVCCLQIIFLFLKGNISLQISLWKSILKIHLKSLGLKFQSICTLLFSIEIWFWIKHESKLEVPNKWDNSKLNLCILIGDLVGPLHKKITFFFQKKKLLTTCLFCCISENKFWFDLLMILQKIFLRLYGFIDIFKMNLELCFELKSIYEMEDINYSFRGFVFTRFWKSEIFL